MCNILCGIFWGLLSSPLLFYIVLCPDTQRTPEEGWRIQQPTICYNNKDADNSLKNHTQNNEDFISTGTLYNRKVVRYCLILNSTVLKHCNQNYEYVAVQKFVYSLYIIICGLV